MSTGLDKQLVLEFYQRMPDDEIILILKHDLKGLTPEAQDVIKAEIERRKLDFDVSKIAELSAVADEFTEPYKEEGCPVYQHTRIWIEKLFLVLLGIFGEEETQYRKVLTPERKYFPVKYDGSERAAFDTLKIVANQMEVPIEKISLDFYDENLRQITEGTPGGFYWGKGENDNFEISMAKSFLDEPETMVAVLAHEIAHIKLLGESRMDKNDEYITDLTTIFFGLGIFNANAAFETFNTAKTYGWSKLGYLTQMEWGYALALFAYIRQEPEPEWASHLCKNVKGDFVRGMQFIIDNEELIFQQE